MPRMRAAPTLCCAALLLALAGGCTSASPPAAPTSKSLKREGPVEVAPVRIGTMEISVVHWGTSRGLAQNGGYIAANDIASGRELWLLKVYDVPYDPKRERDVQDTFIVEMKLDASGSAVLIRDELDRVFVVDPRTRSVHKR
jgi:hypothetical protein